MGSDTSSRFVLPALLILCAVLRMFGLGHADFWYDEAYSLAESADLKGILSGELIGSDAPLFLVLLHGWRQLFDGEFALRLLSALFGVLAVAAVYCAAERLINQRTAIVAGTLAAVSPFFIYYAQELRVYSLLAFVTCGSLITL